MPNSIEKNNCLRKIKDRIISDFYVAIALMQQKKLIILKSDMPNSIEKDNCLRKIKDRIISDFYVAIAQV